MIEKDFERNEKEKTKKFRPKDVARENASTSEVMNVNKRVRMSRLEEDLHPALSGSVLGKLFKKSIFTCLSFVRTNPELLARATGLQYNEILEVKDVILKKYSSKLRNGHKYCQELVNDCAIIPSGIENLDRLLDSGFMTGNIYELCGFAGSGKTQICMTVAVNICTSATHHRVLYIDTKNDVSAHRLADIIDTRGEENVGETLQRVQLSRIRTACDLLQNLHRLESMLRTSPENHLGFRLVVIDSLSALFQHFRDHSESLSLLNSTADLLRYISSEYHLVVLLTNFARSWTAEEVDSEEEDQVVFQQVEQPALGKYWAHVPSVRMMVKRVYGCSECYLIVLKSPEQPVGKSVKVRIGDDGVT